jgi:hypothetical protein
MVVHLLHAGFVDAPMKDPKWEQALSTGCSCRPTARAKLAKFAADKRGF